MNDLRQITIKSSIIKNSVPKSDIQEIQKMKAKEPFYFIDEKKLPRGISNDPLVNVEISLRKCKRLGLFD